MNTSRRDFLKYAGVLLLPVQQQTTAPKTDFGGEERGYEAYVLGCPDKARPIYVPGNLVRVNANSLDAVLPLIETEARKQFPKDLFPMIHIDRVYRGKEIVYKTAWDEIGPLGAVKLESA